MQLTGRPRSNLPRLTRLVVFAVASWVAVSAREASGADPRSIDGSMKSDVKESAPGAAAAVSGDTTTQTATLEFAAYDDTDHVTVFTPSIAVGIENASGASLRGSYLVDVVSAASVDIVSTASSRWREVRHAGTLGVEYKPRDFGVAIDGAISSEPDYLSYGASLKVIKDFDEKNWTVTLGYGFSHDTAGRCDGSLGCTPFSVFSRDLMRNTLGGDVAWVVNRTSIAAVGLDFVEEDGDQSKPYRYIPMFAPNVAPTIPAGASIAVVNASRLPERPLEQLPLSRRRGALVGRFAHRFEGSTLRIEERLYNDSWGMVASSTDAKWIFDIGSRFELWPHARFHVQSPVSFWERAYVSSGAPGWNLPEYRTGDRELGPLWTSQGGLGARWFLGTSANLRSWQLGLTGDVMYTSFLNDLYLTYRVSTLVATTLGATW
jgi:hypothetical protein